MAKTKENIPPITKEMLAEIQFMFINPIKKPLPLLECVERYGRLYLPPELAHRPA